MRLQKLAKLAKWICKHEIVNFAKMGFQKSAWKESSHMWKLSSGRFYHRNEELKVQCSRLGDNIINQEAHAVGGASVSCTLEPVAGS